MKKLIWSVTCLSMLCCLIGCGVYSASSGRVEDSRKYVYVDFLDNNTAEPGIGTKLTELIVDKLQEDNTLKVADRANASSVIEGTVTLYRVKEAFATGDLTVNEYQVQISVKLSFTVNATGEKIINNKKFSGTGNYILNDQNATEDNARDEAAGEIVKDVLAMVVEDW